jgi:Ubiquitin carboxyl-terminal hydrolase, family 1
MTYMVHCDRQNVLTQDFLPAVAGPGILQKFIHKTKHLSPDERAELLERYTELADAHSEGAQQGQTEVNISR